MEKVRVVKSADELKPLAASIAHHRAVSLLRERFAKKRDEGKTESLDASAQDGGNPHNPPSDDSPLTAMEQRELAQRLGQSLTELKPPLGEVLSDFFLQGLRYEEIARKRGVAVGSVGVYLRRGLEATRRIWRREEIVETNGPAFAMNSMNDERFFDLAVKVIARQATDAERTELDALLAHDPDLRAEFGQLQSDIRTAKEALPLVEATRATAGKLRAYARGRLQAKVRQTLGRPATDRAPDRALGWGWRWVLGLAAGAVAVVLLVALPLIRTPNAIVIQLAMLDTAGDTRGADTNM